MEKPHQPIIWTTTVNRGESNWKKLRMGGATKGDFPDTFRKVNKLCIMENMNNCVRRDSWSDLIDVQECQQQSSQYNFDHNNLTDMNHFIMDAEEPGFLELQAALSGFEPITDLNELEEFLADLQEPSQCSVDRIRATTNAAEEKELDNSQSFEIRPDPHFDMEEFLQFENKEPENSQSFEIGPDSHFDMEEFLQIKTNEQDNSQFVREGSDDFAITDFLQLETNEQDENTQPVEEPTKSSRLKMKRQRTSFTGEQILELEKEFTLNHRIDRYKRIIMGEKLKLTERQIKTWFQNRRTKEKKELNRRAIPDTNSFISRMPMAHANQNISNLCQGYDSARYTSIPRYLPYALGGRNYYYGGNSSR